MDDVAPGSPASDSHLERVDDQSARRSSRKPADPLAEAIHDRRQVEPTLPAADVCDVRDQSRLVWVGLKSRATRSGAVLTPCTRIVVLPRCA